MAQRRTQPVRLPDYTVFFSYSHDDTEAAKDILPRLKSIPRLRVFFDVANLEGGESFDPTFRENIAICDEFVMLATPSSIARDWVMMEVGAAWILGKRMAPILLGVSAADLPDPMRGFHTTQFSDLEPLLARLRRRSTVGARAKDDRPWTLMLESIAHGAKISPAKVNELLLAGRPNPPKRAAFIVPRIVSLLAPSVWDRRKAQRAVLMGSDEDQKEICRVLKQVVASEDPFLRGEALFSLGRLRASGALGLLRKGLQDPHPYVNACCANALKYVGDASIKQDLRDLIQSTEGSAEFEAVHYYAWSTLHDLEQAGI